uniref:HlyD_D23 domain-containing protein n=1 Tax=Globodera pallida TaxID=36090 RepID=A0A183C8L3_GLOPA
MSSQQSSVGGGGGGGRRATETGLRVGEIIRVKEGQFFPADIVLLSSSEPMGMAYIETAQLDGETNLKIRQAIPNTAELTDVAQLRALNAQIECEPPNRRVNEFAGTLRVANDEKAPLSWHFARAKAKIAVGCSASSCTRVMTRPADEFDQAPLKTCVST